VAPRGLLMMTPGTARGQVGVNEAASLLLALDRSRARVHQSAYEDKRKRKAGRARLSFREFRADQRATASHHHHIAGTRRARSRQGGFGFLKRPPKGATGSCGCEQPTRARSQYLLMAQNRHVTPTVP
jgi:hypothetical protein